MSESSADKLPTRIALVVGNSDYEFVPDLPNAKIDATRIADTLTGLGFEVIFKLDATKDTMVEAATDFIERLDQNTGNSITNESEKSHGANTTTEIALIYYAGHGVEFSGQNYAVPTDFDRGFDADDEQLCNVQQLMYETSARTKNCIVILDACRDTGSLDREAVDTTTARTRHKLVAGLQKMKLRPNSATFVAFAADPGDPAFDGPRGKGSAFTRSLSNYIGIRGLGIHDALQHVSKDVREESKFKQRPWSYSNLTKELCLVPRTKKPFWFLLIAGALIGLLNGIIAYDWTTAHARNVRFNTMNGTLSEPNPYIMLAALFFGLLLGYANWKWGARTLWAAALTVIIYSTIAAGTRYWIAAYAANEAVLNKIIKIASLGDFLNNGQVKESILIVILGGATVGAASVFSGAATTRALWSLSRVSTGAILGALAAGLYVLFLTGQDANSTGSVWPNLLTIWAMTSFWQAMVAANIGYAYATFVPVPDRSITTFARLRSAGRKFLRLFK